MKRFYFPLVIVAALCLSSVAHAGDSGVYVAPKLLFSHQLLSDRQLETTGIDYDFNDDAENSFNGALAVGYDFKPSWDVPVRAELEYAIRQESKMHDDIGAGFFADMKFKDIQTLFLNAYYDIYTGTDFTPYIGAGLGVAFFKSELNYSNVSSSSKRQTNVAWNLGAGVAYSLNDDWSLDLGYRYLSLGDADTGRARVGPGVLEGSAKLQVHEMTLGLRYAF